MASNILLSFLLLALISSIGYCSREQDFQVRSKYVHLAGWSVWGRWSSCSRSCAIGIQHRQRSCIRKRITHNDLERQPEYRPYVATECQGDSRETKTCNTQDCELSYEETVDSSVDHFRDEQCARYNHQEFNGRYYSWTADTTSGQTCALRCRVKDNSFSRVIRTIAQDGTRCQDEVTVRAGQRPVCVLGSCQIVGCDGVLGSRAGRDVCGVCRGDGRTCRRVQLYPRKRLDSYGYHVIMTIPKAACTIRIEHTEPWRSVLALKDLGSSRAYPFINGGHTLSRNGGFKAAGTVFYYKRSVLGSKGSEEVISAEGPLTSEIQIQIMNNEYKGVQREFTVSYYMSKSSAHHGKHDSMRNEVVRYEPLIRYEAVTMKQPTSHTTSSTTSTTTATTSTTSTTSTTTSSTTSTTTARTSTTTSTTTRNPQQHQSNNHVEHRNRHNKHRRRQKNTYRLHHNNVYENTASRTSAPLYPDQYSPYNSERRHKPILIPRYKTPPSQYTPDERRNMVAVPGHGYYDHLGTVRARNHQPKLSDSKVYTYQWKIKALGECSKTCGGGVQIPKLLCIQLETLTQVTNESCASVPKPAVNGVPCNTHDCPAEWETEEWSVCTEKCGGGSQTRILRCMKTMDGVRLEASASMCKEARPLTQRACNVKSCYGWHAGSWGHCSVSCGHGYRQRTVHCRNSNTNKKVSNAKCTDEPPASRTRCSAGSCARGWYFSHWDDQCDGSCNDGAAVEHRQVKCVDKPCADSDRPSSTRSCTATSSCGNRWFTGPWSKCSSACGDGAQNRDVVCVSGTAGDDQLQLRSHDQCSANHKPDKTRKCVGDACEARWFMSPWNQCSGSCGEGVSSRNVACLDGSGVEVDTCRPETKPDSEKPCQLHACPLQPTDEPAEDCTDTYSRCNGVIQARLCNISYYSKICCKSCKKHLRLQESLKSM